MITLKVALDFAIACLNFFSCFEPSIVRLGSLIVVEAAGRDRVGELRDDERERVAGALRRGRREVGVAAAGRVVADAPVVGERCERKERSSRKKISRFLPQRTER